MLILRKYLLDGMLNTIQDIGTGCIATDSDLASYFYPRPVERTSKRVWSLRMVHRDIVRGTIRLPGRMEQI